MFVNVCVGACVEALKPGSINEKWLTELKSEKV